MSANPETHTCWKCGHSWEHGQHGGHSCSDRLLKALESSRAEVKRLTEEARRSDAGRVEVPELTCQNCAAKGCPFQGKPSEACWEYERLSPAPQPSADVVVVLQRFVDWCEKYPSSRIYSHGEVVTIARKMDEIHEAAKIALRSSTNQKPALVVGDCVTSEHRNDLGGFVRHSFSGAMPDAIIAQSWDYRTPLVDGSLDGLTRYSEDQVSMEDCLRAAERRKLATNHDAQDAGA